MLNVIGLILTFQILVAEAARSSFFSNKQKPVPLLVASGSYRALTNEDVTTVTPPGFWMDWTSWSDCTRTCGGGSFMRMRMCMPMGSNCVGRLVEMRGCNAHPCPLSVWTAWSSWGACGNSPSGSCERKRTRLCAPLRDGCGSGSEDVQSCDGSVCAPVASQTTAGPTPTSATLQGAVYSEWSEWTLCNVACKSTRTRTCTGSECQRSLEIDYVYCTSHLCSEQVGSWGPWTTASVCECPEGSPDGVRVRTRSCPIGRVCDGRPRIIDPCTCSATALGNGWRDWGTWSACDCVNQVRYRERSCAIGIAQCTGESRDEEKCACLSSSGRLFTEWSEWTSCPADCKGAKQYRRRTCAVSDLARCGHKNAEIESKNCPCSHEEPEPNQFAPTIGFSPWSSWSDCDCASNRQYRRRMCSSPRPPIPLLEPDCEGAIEESRVCSGPQPTCDPVDGGWSEWSEYSGCPNNCGCGGIRSFRIRICSNPVNVNKGKDCYGPKAQYKPCNNGPCPVTDRIDGKPTEWSEWTECDGSCVPGKEWRYRSCTNPAPHNGGGYCGHLVENRPCTGQTPQCDVVVGKWSAWSSWSPCDQSCGRAMRTSIRTCSNPTPTNPKTPCYGRVKWFKPCFDLPPC